MEITELSKSIQKNSEMFAELMGICSTYLRYKDEASEYRDYLKNRLPEKVNGFTFGYFPKNDQLHDIFQYIKPEVLENAGLIYKKDIYDSGHQESRWVSKLSNHNLVMSYKNTYGDIIGLVGRTLLSKEDQSRLNISKYKNTSILKSNNLFGLYDSKKYIVETDKVYVVEGQLDCITCHRFGHKNVVALGGSSFTQYHLLLLKRFTKNICLMLDNDQAGKISTEKIISRFGKYANLSCFDIPDPYKDIDEYLNSGGII